jgi:uncharacterized protein (TIGR03546 family)
LENEDMDNAVTPEGASGARKRRRGWSLFQSTLRGIDTPNRLAWGYVLGLAIGMMPKSSLLVFVLFIILMLSRANLTSGIFGFCLGLLCLPLFTPVFRSIGLWAATMPELQPFWVELQRQPVIPWFSLNHTVVLGSLLVSLSAALPVFLFSRTFFKWFRPMLVHSFGGE